MPGKIADRNVDLRFTDGSEINRFAAGIYGRRDKHRASIPTGSFSGVLLAQATTILRCAQLLVPKNVPRRRINTCSDSRAAKAKLYKITIESPLFEKVCKR